MRKVLITGGAGFVGCYIAKAWKESFTQDEVCVFDNLHRRGSELNLAELKKRDIKFVHGDIRFLDDLLDLNENFDLMIEASAEPSVLSGLNGSPSYLLNTNLFGSVNCLEFLRQRCPNLIFLSTSRVYSISSLKNIPLSQLNNRYILNTEEKLERGISKNGISEEFNTTDFRSLYGTTKLCSEQIIQEYVHSYKLNAVINRCGVIAGPGQWGKVDQGVFTLWMAKHFFKGSLKYTGFEGEGFQVRDLLHPEDLFNLLKIQADDLNSVSGRTYNIGGGSENSISLKELSILCKEITGNEIGINSDPNTNPVDIPYYVTDYSNANSQFSWSPKINLEQLFVSIRDWLEENKKTLKPLFME